MAAIDNIIQKILAEEGGYTNDPNDAGGATKFGVTQATLANYRGHPVTADDVKALTMAEADKIYRQMYYTSPGFDKVAALSQPIADKLTDAGVNMGPNTPSTFLQRALNAFLDQDMATDGRIGPSTLNALSAYLKRRGKEGETVMLRALNDLQGARYIQLSEARHADREFVYGWLLNRVQ